MSYLQTKVASDEIKEGKATKTLQLTTVQDKLETGYEENMMESELKQTTERVGGYWESVYSFKFNLQLSMN